MALLNYSMEIRVANTTLVPAIAEIHYQSLREDFLPSLGLDFLIDVYYPAALKSANGETLVALIHGEPAGFVTISPNSEAFTRDIWRGRLLPIGLYALRAALRDISHISRSLEVFRAAALSESDPIQAEIVYIAVSESYRRQGIGRKLVGLAMDHLRGEQVFSCRTKTLADNTGVIGMYEHMGWHVRGHFRLIGREYVTLVSGDLRDSYQ